MDEARLQSFLVTFCAPPQVQSSLGEEQQQTNSSRVLFTQEVDCMKLLQHCPEAGRRLYTDTLALMRELAAGTIALCRAAGQALEEEQLSIRLTHLPCVSASLPSLPPPQGQLVQVCGSIVRMTAKKVVPHAYRLLCPRCRGGSVSYTSALDRAAKVKRCCPQSGCRKEELQSVGEVWMDYAECRLQQRANQTGRLPRSLLVTLDDELSTKCVVGQFVEVIGVLFPRWRHVFPLSTPAIEPTVWAINVLPMEAYRGSAAVAGAVPRRRAGAPHADGPKFTPEGFFLSLPKSARGVALVRSVTPQLAGLYAPRMSVLLSALGGAATGGKTTMHIRSTIHCLYVGDPATGKSQLLRFAAAIAPRSTSTTGMGSTSAGLTVAAAKEHGEWVLEPGALVLSDGGSCIIDELRTVSPADRASLHEAMEQQTISVAKGGIVTKLRTACAVLSACNPPSRRSERTTIGVGGPLLSRFDFIYLLWDTPLPAVDERIADHVLAYNAVEREPTPPLSTADVACYLWWVRSQFAHVDGPLLADGAAELLGKYYAMQRQRGATPALEDAVPVTVRLLESLVRIAQAHAKLHLQPVCTVDDAAMAIFLMERSAHGLKVPLAALGPDVYSSSRELDDVFLSDSAENTQLQKQVLESLVHVVANYGTQGQGWGEDPTGRVPLAEQQPQGGEPTTLLTSRAQLSQAHQQSIRRLEREITTPSVVARTVTSYPRAHDDDRSQADAQQILFSHRLSSRRSRPASQDDGSEGAPPPPVVEVAPPSASAELRARAQDPTPSQRLDRDDEEEELFMSDSGVLSQAVASTPKCSQGPATEMWLSANSVPTESQTLLRKRKRSADEIMQSLRFHF
ncbi:minichromosome maintenance protein 9 [Strigomonas culicis]|uniref:Minichromosome maintenance protein 9 n=1 Tax=Strigomonas culicis TaxID=28005 RepID=S9TU90_9TRYP|nr:minichromosome maintenance protein 9 [Strigomonas culicis]|eukprot:EPY21997.1 minichromosome maintenance protein 9 [Strigomonas culicis]